MLIGLTGTFSSGKSLVARFLEEYGASIVDADQLARQAVEPGAPALEEIRIAFGPEFIASDGRLDRPRMGREVFADPDKRQTLNAIVHPRVRRGIETHIARFREEGAPLIALDVPLLFEAGMTDLTDAIVVVTISEAQRFRRARLRDGLGERDIIRRIAAQWPQRRKIEQADAIIDNSGSKESTRRQTRRLYEQWIQSNPIEQLSQE